MDGQKNIGKKIKQLRASKDMLQKDLATQLQISTRTLQKYEKNEITPSIDMLEKIATIFGKTNEYLG